MGFNNKIVTIQKNINKLVKQYHTLILHYTSTEHLLPPLQFRPQLMGFTRVLSLPTAYVTLSPFPLSLDFRYSKKPSPHKYFFLERSYVQYYR